MSQVFTHKCPNCDGPLLFDPKTQKFHCEYCLSTFTEEEIASYEQQSHTEEPHQASSTQTEENMDIFSCSSCGAQIVTDSTTAATFCYFCHNPVILSGRVSGKFLPEKVLPFKIEKEEAIKKFLSWTGKKHFIPKSFFNKQQIEKLTGVYFPYWAVNASIDGSLQGTGTKVRIWRVGDIEYTETKKFKVKRKGRMKFSDFVQNALSKNTVDKMIDSVQPFPIEQAVDFKTQYLAGFQAEKRDIEYENIQEHVQKDLKNYATSLLKNTVSEYSFSNNITINHVFKDETKHYLLLPIWIVTYKSSDSSKKTYYYAMNGQTGKTSGVLPIDYKHLVLTSSGIFLIILIIGLIGGWFL